MQLFRESLLGDGFIEVHTPKLLSGASEGGAAVFKFDYMGRPGCLAQVRWAWRGVCVKAAPLQRVRAPLRVAVPPVLQADGHLLRLWACI